MLKLQSTLIVFFISLIITAPSFAQVHFAASFDLNTSLFSFKHGDRMIGDVEDGTGVGTHLKMYAPFEGDYRLGGNILYSHDDHPGNFYNFQFYQPSVGPIIGMEAPRYSLWAFYNWNMGWVEGDAKKSSVCGDACSGGNFKADLKGGILGLSAGYRVKPDMELHLFFTRADLSMKDVPYRQATFLDDSKEWSDARATIDYSYTQVGVMFSWLLTNPNLVRDRG